MSEICIPCEHARRQQMEYRNFLLKKIKQRAINEQCNYAVWFDAEIKKFVSAKYDDAKGRSIRDLEIVSFHP